MKKREIKKSPFFIFFKKMLDKPGILWYYNTRRKQKGDKIK